MFERLYKWMTQEISNRSGLISTPTALLVDGSRPIEPIKRLALRSFVEKLASHLPAKAVAFLAHEDTSEITEAYVVDVERHAVLYQVVLSSRQEIGEFAAAFLSCAADASRSIQTAPRWFITPKWSHEAQTRSLPQLPNRGLAVMARKDGSDHAADGIIVEEKKPPQPPRVQALIALADETAALHELPVVITATLA